MLTKILNLKNILFFLWIIFFGSLGAKWNYGELNFSSIHEMLNLFRFFCFFVIPPIFYFYFKFIKNLKFDNDFVLKCFYIIFIFQLIGFANFYYFNQSLYETKLFDKNLIASGYNLRFSYSFYICLSSLLPLPFICMLANKVELSNQILKLSIIILVIITSIFLAKIMYDFYKYDKIYFYHLNFLTWGKILDVSAPRATGISKWLLILYFFIFSYLLCTKKNERLMIVLIIFIGICIYLFQSRTSIYFLFFFTFTLLLKDKKYLSNFFKILIIFLTIFLSSNLIIKLKHQSIIKNVETKIENLEIEIKSSEIEKGNQLESEIKKLNERKLIISEKPKNRNFGDEDNFSTGRIQIWLTLTEYIFKTKFQNLLLGFGPQADRYLSGQNASSAIFYTLITSGLLGFFLYVLICLRILYLFFRIFKSRDKIKKVSTKKLHYLFFSIFILTYLMCRSLVEISYMIFGVDFLFFLICYINLLNLVKYFENIQSKNP